MSSLRRNLSLRNLHAHEAVGRLISKSDMRHPLPVVWLVAGQVAADSRAGQSAHRKMAGVIDLSRRQVYVSGSVVLFDPGFVVLVAHAEDECEVR